MERVCPKCGTLVSGEGTFCPECGTHLDNVIDLNAPQSIDRPVSIPAPTPMPTNGYTQNAEAAPNPASMGYNQIPQYPQSYNNAPVEEPQEKMSVGAWVGTVILTTWFWPISLIILLVWAFGNTPQPKKNYCRAMLIFQLIALILGVVAFVVFMTIIGWDLDAFVRAIKEFGEDFGEEFSFYREFNF